MSVTPDVSWLKRNYEKAILLVVLLALIASVGGLVQRITDGRSLIAAASAGAQSNAGQPFKPVDQAVIDQRLQSLHTPAQAALAERRLFISEVRKSCTNCFKAIPVESAKCAFCGSSGQPVPIADDQRDTDRDGIPDKWERDHGLNPLDPSDAVRDNDGDGFTNLEEHLAKTRMDDKNDFPPIEAKLRIFQVRKELFFLRFNGVQELVKGEIRFQLNLRTGDRTYFLKLGDTVEGCTLESYDEKSNTLTLKKGDRVIPLVRNKPVNDDELHVWFLLLTDYSIIRTKAGQNFQIADKDFRVESVRDSRVRIRRATAGSPEMVVPDASDAERAEFQRRRRGTSTGNAPAAVMPEGIPPVKEYQ